MWQVTYSVSQSSRLFQFKTEGGTFIRYNHVLTAASCVHERDPGTYRVHSGAANITGTSVGTPHIAHRVFVHDDFDVTQPLVNNVAVVLLRLADSAIPRPTALEPRNVGQMRFGRFCNLFGWEGFRNILDTVPLRMYPLVIANGTANGTICQPEHIQAHCTAFNNLTSHFENCGGLMGAPIFCTGSISGIVVLDNFCQTQPTVRASFLPLEDFEDWINEVSAAKIGSLTSSSLVLASLIVFFVNQIR